MSAWYPCENPERPNDAAMRWHYRDCRSCHVDHDVSNVAESAFTSNEIGEREKMNDNYEMTAPEESAFNAWYERVSREHFEGHGEHPDANLREAVRRAFHVGWRSSLDPSFS